MEERRTRRGPIWTCAGILTLLMIYPLSVGPLYWMACRGLMSEATLEMLGDGIYYPLVVVLENVPLANELFQGYQSFWDDLAHP